MALLSCGWPWFRGFGPNLGTTHRLIPTFIRGPCQLQASVFTFSFFSLHPLVRQLWERADLEGRTQAGQWRLGVGTQLESTRSKRLA